MIWLHALWGRVWPYIALVAAAFAAFFGIRQAGKAAGRAEAKAEQAEATIKGMEDAREARAEIDSLDDAAVRDRARQRMRNAKR
ncbi:hypothetical protein H0A65_10835 [Alcaligenaceae bacterium]|nr:hypothetical protein [Alcaligenaceae bacterium]